MLRLGNSFIQNPHPSYAQMRLQGPTQPVLLWGGVRVWMVTRYDEARALLADPRVKKDGPTATALFPPGTYGSIGTVLGDNMLFKDPPDHTRLRRFVTAAFTAHAVKRLRPVITRITDELLDALPTVGEVDLVAAYAQPLPVRVIGELLGVPADIQDTFTALVIPIFTSTDVDELVCAQRELTELLRAVIAAKRTSPGDDMLSSLVHQRDQDDRLSEEELLGTAFLLIIAGYDTTVNLIGNGILALLQHPDQLRAVRADRTLLPDTVEEVLRYESPLNTATVRFTSEPVSLGGTVIPAGELVLIALLGANHDEDRFTDADRFDVFRQDNRHVAFGHGIHHCVGAPLARLEGEIAFDRLLTRYADIRLSATESLTYRPSTLMRGLQALPVTLNAAPASATVSDHDRMMGMVTGFWVSQIVSAAATFNLADHLATGTDTAVAISAVEGTDVDATRRLLRTCASLGLVASVDGVHFSATSLLNTLRKDEPKSLRGLAMAQSAPGHWAPWGRFPDAVRSGDRQIAAALDPFDTVFDYYAAHPDEGTVFTEAMSNLTAPAVVDIALAVDTRGVRCALDVGGADGAVVRAMMRANPELHGGVFDLPHVVADAYSAARADGLQDRFTAIAGDFFASVPPADLYVLKYVLHDWDDERCIRILENCAASLQDGGRIVVVDYLVGALGDPGPAPFMDMNMLVMTGGKERDIAEFDALFAAAGLRRTAVGEGGDYAVIEVVPVERPPAER